MLLMFFMTYVTFMYIYSFKMQIANFGTNLPKIINMYVHFTILNPLVHIPYTLNYTRSFKGTPLKESHGSEQSKSGIKFEAA